jgi:hypothetical protein
MELLNASAGIEADLLRKRCEDASHSKTLRAKSMRTLSLSLPTAAGLWECARVLASLSQHHHPSVFALCSICSRVGSLLRIHSRA